MRSLVVLLAVSSIALICRSVAAVWIEQTLVNQGTTDLQACRDSDTPWSHVIDDSNNVHFVFETKDDAVQNLAIHYRVRRSFADWSEEISATIGENVDHSYFGHPSIVIGNDFKGYVAYVMDAGWPPDSIEMRIARIDFDDPNNPFIRWDYMSDDGFPYVVSYLSGARKTPVITKDSSGTYHGFWIYRINTQPPWHYAVYHNIADDTQWGTEAAPQVIDDSIYEPYMLNTKTDPEGNVHLLVSGKSDSLSPSIEVYEFWYDVGSSSWYGPKLVSEAAYPDGNTSNYAYGVFSGDVSNWRYHIVWQEQVGSNFYVQYRRFNSSLQTWSPIRTLASPNAKHPCLAVDSDNIVHFIWDDTVAEYEKRWIYHGYYNPAIDSLYALEWLPNNPDFRRYTLPVVVTDRWDNIHVTGIAFFEGSSSTDSEVLYSFNDAPPRAPRNLIQLFGNDNVTLSWSANPEPDFDHYMVKRQIKDWIAYYSPITDTFFVDREIPEFDGISRKSVLYWVYAYDTLDQQSRASDTLIVFINPNWHPKTNAGHDIPTEFGLSINSPNPFNATTEIRYALPIDCDVKLTIYDIAGRRVRELVDNHQNAGYKSTIWDGRDSYGNSVASGVYIYRLDAAGQMLTKRMLMIK